MDSSGEAGHTRDAYDGLEVVNDHAHNAPELDLRHQPDKEALYPNESQLPTAPLPKRRICGMRRPVALGVFAIIALVVVGAVVGGAVGGTHASSSHKR